MVYTWFWSVVVGAELETQPLRLESVLWRESMSRCSQMVHSDPSISTLLRHEHISRPAGVAWSNVAFLILVSALSAPAQSYFDWTLPDPNPPSHPPGRWDAAMAYDAAHQQSVLFGGYEYSTKFGDTWLFDGASWRQAYPSTAPSPRASHAMAYESRRGVAVPSSLRTE